MRTEGEWVGGRRGGGGGGVEGTSHGKGSGWSVSGEEKRKEKNGRGREDGENEGRIIGEGIQEVRERVKRGKKKVF